MAAQSAKLFDDRSKLLLTVDKSHHISALRGEMTGKRPAQSTCSPAYDRNFALDRIEFVHMDLFSNSFFTAAIMPSTWPRASMRPWKL